MGRRILEVIFDILMLAALIVAGAGHFMPWCAFPTSATDETLVDMDIKLQVWHATGSGIALGVTTLMLFLSLMFSLGIFARRVLLVLMFVSLTGALFMQITMFSSFRLSGLPEPQRQLDTFFLALIPTCIALFFCLVRMSWTMVATSKTAR